MKLRLVAVSLAFMGFLLGFAAYTDTSIAQLEPQANQTFNLFTDASPPILLNPTKAERGATRSRTVRINFDVLRTSALRANPEGDQEEGIQLNLFDDVFLVSQPNSLVAHPVFEDGYVWSGNVPDGDVVFAVGGGQAAGTILVPGKVYEIRYLTEDVYEIVEYVTDIPQLPDDPIMPPTSDVTPPTLDFVLQDANPNSIAMIDYMVVYTDDARVAAGGVTQIVNAITVSVGLTNQALLNSEIYAYIRLVRVEEINYVETGNTSTDLARLSNTSDGYLDTIPTLRNAYAADVVTFITETTDGVCGRAFLMSSSSASNPLNFAPLAYSIVARGCLQSGKTMAHELGHNFGMAHDAANSAGLIPLFNYAYGYQHPDGILRTIMAYQNGCNGPCPQLNRFSSATNLLGIVPMGSASANAEAVLNFSLPYVARFRNGTIATATPTYTAPAPIGTNTSNAPTPTATTTPTCTASISPGNTAQLISAITAANTNGVSQDVICLANGSTYNVSIPDNGYNGFPIITTPITIVGNNATLTKPTAQFYRFFEVGETGFLTISRLTLQNGKADPGGAISVSYGGKIVISDSLFRNNVSGFGGAVFVVNRGTSSHIHRSVFTGNIASSGGGVYLTLTQNIDVFGIRDSVFIENGADSLQAGSSVFASGSGTTVISNSCLYRNTGYSVYRYSFDTTMTINATNNWWGASTGPVIETNPVAGAGVDMIDGNVNYLPYSYFMPTHCLALINPPTATPTPSPTTTPQPSVINVSATLQGRNAAPNDALIVPLHIIIKPVSGGAIIVDTTVTTNNQAIFTLIGLAEGSYTLWVKGTHTLATSQTVTIMPGINSISTPLLREGDADNNNAITLPDFSLLASSYGTAVGQANYNSQADFNGDGQVLLPDFSLLVSNFGMSGAGQP